MVTGSCLGKGREAHARITAALGEHRDVPLCLRLKAQGREMSQGLVLPWCRRWPMFAFSGHASKPSHPPQLQAEHPLGL